MKTNIEGERDLYINYYNYNNSLNVFDNIIMSFRSFFFLETHLCCLEILYVSVV